MNILETYDKNSIVDILLAVRDIKWKVIKYNDMFVYSHDILTIYSEKYIVRIDIKFLEYEISVRKNYNFIQKYICENIECPDLNFVGF